MPTFGELAAKVEALAEELAQAKAEKAKEQEAPAPERASLLEREQARRLLDAHEHDWRPPAPVVPTWGLRPRTEDTARDRPEESASANEAVGFWARLTSEAETGGGYYSWTRLQSDAENTFPATGTDNAKEVNEREAIGTDESEGAGNGEVVWMWPVEEPEPREYRFAYEKGEPAPGQPGERVEHFAGHYRGEMAIIPDEATLITVLSCNDSFVELWAIARECLETCECAWEHPMYTDPWPDPDLLWATPPMAHDMLLCAYFHVIEGDGEWHDFSDYIEVLDDNDPPGRPAWADDLTWEWRIQAGGTFEVRVTNSYGGGPIEFVVGGYVRVVTHETVANATKIGNLAEEIEE